MADWFEAMGLHHFGFNDEQIAQIDAAVPKAQYVLNLVQNNHTVINELFTVAKMIVDQIAQYQKDNPS